MNIINLKKKKTENLFGAVGLPVKNDTGAVGDTIESRV